MLTGKAQQTACDYMVAIVAHQEACCSTDSNSNEVGQKQYHQQEMAIQCVNLLMPLVGSMGALLLPCMAPDDKTLNATPHGSQPQPTKNSQLLQRNCSCNSVKGRVEAHLWGGSSETSWYELKTGSCACTAMILSSCSPWSSMRSTPMGLAMSRDMGWTGSCRAQVTGVRALAGVGAVW
jgi:hypothetical protein